jgi:glycogen operon protein
VKLIAEAWDAGGLYQVGSFPSWNRWAEWNGRYRDDMRNYLKGDYDMWNIAAQRITGSRDLYPPELRGFHASVNFIDCHDGFSMWDIYSYNEKHNLANGWNNTDGSDDNRSWNCGVEGETDNGEILALRHKMMRNAFAVLMLSRGMPMFLAGDEFCNTQYGNNNAYCQDNEISWLDWGCLKTNRETYEFFRYMIHFRKKHKVIRKFAGCSALGYPEIQIVGPDHNTKISRVIYAGRNEEDSGDEIICLAINIYWEEQEFYLPDLPNHLHWCVVTDTGRKYLPKMIPEENEKLPELESNRIRMVPRSVCVFINKEK